VHQDQLAAVGGLVSLELLNCGAAAVADAPDDSGIWAGEMDLDKTLADA
jgi:hypothetical protein